MLKEQNVARHSQLEQELSRFCYRRLMLSRELETIDKGILGIEGALRENEATQRDVKIEEAIEAAKTNKPDELGG